MKYKSKFLSAVAAAALLSTLLLGGCGKSDDTVAQFPTPSLDNRVEFHQPADKDAAESDRIVHYAPDHKTKIGADIFYKNGNTGSIVYRTFGEAAGTIETAVVKYPLQEGQKTAQVAREVHLDLDGHTFIKDRVYTVTGVLKYAGDRTAADKYETTEYRTEGADGGKGVKKHQTLVHDYDGWKVDTEQLYRDDSSLEKTVQRRDDGSTITKLFNAQSKLEQRTILSSYGNSQTTEWYDADGTTINKVAEQTGYDVTVTNYSQGKKVEVLRFWSDLDNINVEQYGPDEHLRLRQHWETKKTGDMKTDGKVDPSKYQLNLVEYYDATGFNNRDVHFTTDPNGVRYIDRITDRDPHNRGYYYDGGPGSTTTLRPDGTVDTVVTRSVDGSTKTDNHTVADNVRVTLDKNDFAIGKFEEPPKTLKVKGYGGYFYGR